jgi:pSer/pThr/pTyr-binding forkhead associated (FHA) protein
LNYIGRSEDNQIRIAEPRASRRHALVAVFADGYTVKDLQSQNGTFVNGERITERTLADGDCIGIGDFQLIFRSPWPAPAAGAGAVSKTAASKRTKS